MTERKTLLFAPAAYNLAETSRMVEIAKGVRDDPTASAVFEIRFISEGGDFERLIEGEGFALHRVEPRLTPEKIEHILAVNDEETYAPAFTTKEMIAKVKGDIAALDAIRPDVVVTGSYLSMPPATRIRGIPLVWAVQSTWLPAFFGSGAGRTDSMAPGWRRSLVNAALFAFIRSWMWFSFIRPVNAAAKRLGGQAYPTVFDYFVGDITLVAEPDDFADVPLPPRHFYIGPLIPESTFDMPPEVRHIERDLPLVYLAMGSSGVERIVAGLIESFRARPYRVVAPVRGLLSDNDVDVPPNVVVTDWLPALEVNKMADAAIIHGGIGTVLTAALAGRPVVGVGMQPEQVANLACLERKGIAIRIDKSKDTARIVAQIQAALAKQLTNPESARAASTYAARIQRWRDAPERAAQLLVEHYGPPH